MKSATLQSEADNIILSLKNLMIFILDQDLHDNDEVKEIDNRIPQAMHISY